MCSGLNCAFSVNAKAGDVLVIIVGASPQSVIAPGRGCTAPEGCYVGLTTPPNSSGLNFQLRLIYNINPHSGDGSFMWTYWAVAPTTMAYPIMAAVNYTSTAWNMVGFSVTNVNTADPWATGINIDTTAATGGNMNFNDCNPSGSDGCSVPFSTTATNVFAIAGIVGEGNMCSPAAPPSAPSNGYTIINCASDGYVGVIAAFNTYSLPVTNLQTGGWKVGTEGASALWWLDGLTGCITNCAAVTSSSSASSSTSTSTSSTMCMACTPPPSGLTQQEQEAIALVVLGLLALVYLKHKRRI